MNKVRLNLEQLQVESFHTLADRPGRGTVRGNNDAELGEAEFNITPPTNPNLDCRPISAACSIFPSCAPSCPQTCMASCGCTALCSYGCTEVLSECRFTGDPVCCV